MLRAVGDAEAAKTHAVGGAEAEVIKLKIASMAWPMNVTMLHTTSIALPPGTLGLASTGGERGPNAIQENSNSESAYTN